MKNLVKALGISIITLPMIIGNPVFAGKEAKKKNMCTAKAAAVAGYNPSTTKKKEPNSEKAKKFVKQYDKCMKGGDSMVNIPGM